MYTSGVGKTIKQARENSLNVAKKIIIPRVFYRNDIGEKLEEDMPTLKKLGYIKNKGLFRTLFPF